MNDRGSTERLAGPEELDPPIRVGRIRRRIVVGGDLLVVDAPADTTVDALGIHINRGFFDGSRRLRDVLNGESLEVRPTGGVTPSLAKRPRWKIVAESGPDALREWRLSDDDFVVIGRTVAVGRHSNVSEGARDGDATPRFGLCDGLISMVHAVVATNGDGVFVADDLSTNGTVLGGQSVGPEGAQWFESDPLHIGQSKLRIAACNNDNVSGPPEAEWLDGDDFDVVNGTFPVRRVFALPADARPAIPAPSTKSLRARMRFRPGSVVGPLIGAAAMAMLLDPKFAVFALLSPVMLFINFIDDRRMTGRERRTGERDFAAEFAEFRQSAEQALEEEQTQRHLRFVSPLEALTRAQGHAAGLWSADFSMRSPLPVRIGTGTVRFVPNLIERGPRAGPVTTFCASLILRDVPVCVPLGTASCVTFAGPSSPRAVLSVLMQVVTMVSPQSIAVLVDSDGAIPWWADLLPHQIQRSRSNDGVVPTGEVEGRGLLMVQLRGAGPRAAAQRERLRSLIPTAMFVVAVDETSEAPPETTTLVENCNRPDCRLVCVGGDAGDGGAENVEVDGVGEDAMGQVAQALARWHDPRTPRRRDIVRSDVSLDDVLGDRFEMLSASSGAAPSDCSWSVEAFWRQAPTHQRSVVATIGVDGTALRLIDLVCDGPHALIGGTTGSGKSELLRTLIASLAVSYPPEIVTFVLIDYKGGSAFAECSDLPHTVGFVTDLDDGLAARALTCLEAELRRRETLLRDSGARDLVSFAGSPGGSGPLPRLIVVIDELAALVKDIPDFVGALISLAQRGRTLGLHLILATQRPAGTINDAIRANTNIRIALRVQDAADSFDVIADHCAATIDRRAPGRAFVRLGPGELEAVQVASVSLVSSRSAITVTRFDESAVLRATGAAPTRGSSGETVTPLGKLVNEICRTFAETGRSLPRRPWADPLDSMIAWVGAANPSQPMEMNAFGVVIGILDAPSKQHQGPLRLDLQAGSVAVIGPLGAGVTNAIRTIVLGLASSHAPSRLHIYVLDFLGGELASLSALPHVGAVIGPHDVERRERFLSMLANEIEVRRRTESWAVQRQYVVCIDGWSSIRTATSDPVLVALSDAVQRLITEGSAVGIRFILGTDRATSVPSTLAPSFGHRIIFRPIDASEALSAGIPFVCRNRIAGRALITAIPGAEVQVFASSNADIEHLAMSWSDTPRDDAAPPVGVLPGRVFVDQVLPACVTVADGTRVPRESNGAEPWVLFFGISSLSLAPTMLSLRAGEPVLVAGPPRSGRTTALNTILAAARHCRPTIRFAVLSPSTLNVSDWPVQPQCGAQQLATTSVRELRTWVDEAIDSGEAALVLIDDAERIDDEAGQLLALLSSDHHRVRIVVAGRADLLRTAYGHWTAPARRVRQGLALRPNLETDGELWHRALPRRLRIDAVPGRGVLIDEDLVQIVQVAQPRSPIPTDPGR